MSHPPNKSIPLQDLRVGQQVWTPVSVGCANHVNRSNKGVADWRNEVYGTPCKPSDLVLGNGAKLSHTVPLSFEEIHIGDVLWISVNSAVLEHADTTPRRYFGGVYASPGTALQAYREEALMADINPDNCSQFAVPVRIVGSDPNYEYLEIVPQFDQVVRGWTGTRE